MERRWQPLVLPWLTAVVAMNILGSNAVVDGDKLVGKVLLVLFYFLIKLFFC